VGGSIFSAAGCGARIGLALEILMDKSEAISRAIFSF